MKILVVDAFDSFVYILRQYLMSVGAEQIGRASCRERV